VERRGREWVGRFSFCPRPWILHATCTALGWHWKRRGSPGRPHTQRRFLPIVHSISSDDATQEKLSESTRSMGSTSRLRLDSFMLSLCHYLAPYTLTFNLHFVDKQPGKGGVLYTGRGFSQVFRSWPRQDTGLFCTLDTALR